METTQKSQLPLQDQQEPMINGQLSEADALAMVEEGRRMKAALKQLSKNQLIRLLIEQVNFSIEQQNVNKVLLERLKEQK